MSQVESSELRNRVSMTRARRIVDQFHNDIEPYPEETFRLKQGVCKLLAEEFVPIFFLAEKLCLVVRSINTITN